MARLFDVYVVVDWSAAGRPRQGRDSIWYAVVRTATDDRADRRAAAILALENPPTRAAATQALADLLAGLADDGCRVLAGFDFPFGFPAGTAARLGFRGLPWRAMWQMLDDMLADGDDNANNRFDVAERLNERLTGEAFPFWGNVREESRPFLLRRGRRPHGPVDLAERRLCDRLVRSTQPVWKLAGAGAAGSQALTGIPRVWQLRRDPRLAFRTHLWPFETGLRADSRPGLVFAEVYPSLVPPEPLPGYPKDAGQVVAMARYLAALDASGKLEEFLSGGAALDAASRRCIEREESWILGALAT
jgi:precorrin-8X/cobalt-precorrin-8 methylmutase